MNSEPFTQLSRRTFCGALAAAALLLGCLHGAWAATPKFKSKVLWEFDAMDADHNRKSLVRAFKGHA